VLSKLDGYLNELTVPVDGSNSKIHSYSRGLHESFTVSMQLLKIIKAFNIQTDISTVLSKYNVNDIPNILKIVLESGVRKWKIFQFYPLEVGWKNKDRFELSQTEFLFVTKELEKYKSLIEIDIRASDNETMLSYFHISPNGKMLLVDRNKYRDIGNFLDCDDIHSILIKNKFNFKIHLNRHWRDL
jgi:MoaA/NifB/PqqE/SkfB family radical SAM enzyme